MSDQDKPYTWGRLPTTSQPRLFTLRELARLMVLRSRIGDTVASVQPPVLS